MPRLTPLKKKIVNGFLPRMARQSKRNDRTAQKVDGVWFHT
jgi:hypothetical protein